MMLGGAMQGGIRRRRLTAFAVLAMSAAMLGGGAGNALAADGDAVIDQCFQVVPNAPCAAGGQLGNGTIAVHPSQRWVYVASRNAAAPRITVYDRGARGQLTPKAGVEGCVNPTGVGCRADSHLGAVNDIAIDKDGRNLYTAGDN